jgi:hypothetical protein
MDQNYVLFAAFSPVRKRNKIASNIPAVLYKRCRESAGC